MLLVESSPELQSLLTTLFDRAGFNATVVGHGDKAMRLVKDGGCDAFDAIVIQCGPVPSPTDPAQALGVALVNALADRNKSLLAKTVILTTVTRPIPFHLLEACRVVTQPFDLEELTATVMDCIAASKAAGH